MAAADSRGHGADAACVLVGDGRQRGPQALTTIFAPATAPGRAAVAIVRLSGPAAGSVLCALTGRAAPPAPRSATRAILRTPDGTAIDEALVLWFPGPASATGEDIAEFHVHGGRAVLTGLLDAIGAFPDVRPAQAGEFTRRAFEHGKLDLTQAEAVADLVDAETVGQRRQALRQLSGALGRVYEAWRADLVELLAMMEAHLDFPDEDLPEDLPREIAQAISRTVGEMERHLADSGRGERLREGFHVAVVGAPNAGKSSLINALSGRDVAIVSARPGTTRDVIQVALDLGGQAVIVSDTAGLRNAEEDVEEEGIRRARREAQAADLVLVLRDSTAAPDLADLGDLGCAPRLTVANKVDLGGVALAGEMGVSALTGEGLEALVAAIGEVAGNGLAESGAPALTRTRHRAAVRESLAALSRASTASVLELQAEDLRLATRAIGRITGRVDVDDVLDVVFSTFCLGK